MMQALIVGYGSIGKRHARLLKACGFQVAVVTSQTYCEEDTTFTQLSEAVKKSSPDYIVICSATADHGNNLATLSKSEYDGTVLVEKPIVMNAAELSESYPFRLGVAYQLRFHPGIIKLREHLQGQTIYSAHMYVGQHLSQWRPDRKIKETYSAHKEQGGGVVRDLSHELDLVQYLFGDITVCRAIACQVGDVTSDSEDVAVFALRSKPNRLISLQMNYLDHTTRREISVVTKDHSYKLDLVAQTLQVDDAVESFEADADSAYIAMHHAMLDQKGEGVCNLEEALALTQLIDTVAPDH
jgi:predicted dehydrogenase